VLGRSLPLIGTEGGYLPDRPAESRAAAERVLAAYEAVRRSGRAADFAYTYWLIANEEGGGEDRAFTRQALFRADGPSPLVELLKGSAGEAGR
jgi:hypothetical protein